MESSAGTDMASAAAAPASTPVWPVAGDGDEDDEEEARLWAELERLPTPQRARSAVVTLEEENDDGEAVAGGASRKAVVDVGGLGAGQRRALLDCLVGSVEHDNERFLRKLRDRIDRVGIVLPTIEVRFEHLKADAEVHIGTRGLPTILNSGAANALSILPSRKQTMPILNDISGIIKPMRREKAANIKPDADLDAFMKAAVLGGQEANVVTEYMLKILGLEIISSLRQAIHILGVTAVISLLQPAPETYNLFDEIILLSDGQIVYHGPREDILDFFKSMGFRCPERKGVANFLQEVTSKKDQKHYWAHNNQPYRYISVKEFAESFRLFHVGQAMANEIVLPFDKSMNHPSALAASKYGVSTKELLKANMDREILLMKRNSFFYMFRVVQLILLSIIEMTLFFRTEMHRDSVASGGIYMGALFFTTLMIIFNGFSELSLTSFKLPIFFKQRDLLFYPSWTYTVPSWILKIPITVLEVGGIVFITYYAIGFDPDVVRLFKQYLLFLAANQMAAALFRFIAGAARNIIVAYVFGSFAILIFMLLGGFVLSRDNLNKWWIWGYWTSPMMYAQNAVSVNEFLGRSWQKVLPGSTEPLGVLILKSRGIFPEAKWYWIGFAYGRSYPSVSEDMLKEKHANLTGVGLDVYVSIHNKGKALGSNTQSSESACQATGCNNEIKLTSVDANSIPAQRGMVLPFAPLLLTFDCIRYSIDVPQEMKRQVLEDKVEILKGVSGYFRPGVLTALMGISGAGKTTLMDVLAGRKTSGYIKGSISISGYPKKQEMFARVSGYCEQDDIHSPQVTVHESLLFSAWLRLPGDVNSKTRKMFIEEVMELVELTPVRHALVGLPGVNGLSIEKRKRLTIAVELVANPSIIFMDEPTSGLDARAAAIVMRTVRNTVDTGRTVVCTIHQPSIDIFEAFDELLLLKQGGEEIYFGPLGRHSSDMIKYFEAFIHELSTPPLGSSDLHFPTTRSRSFFTQCLACLWKQNLSYWRNPQYNAVRFFFTSIIALLFGTIFWGLGTKREKPQDLFNTMGSMYAAVLTIGVLNAASVQPVVSIERTVFYRERAAGMYSAFPSAFGQVLIELPYTLVQTCIYGAIVYAMMGFKWTVTKFIWYLFFMYFTLLYSTFCAMMAIGLTQNHNVASIVSAAFHATWNLFSGFLIPRTKIPIWWRWYYWLCPVAWSLYGMVVSQYGDVDTPLFDGVSTTTVAKFVSDYFGFEHSFLGVVAAAVVAFALLFALLFGLAIMKLNFQKK
ncbi:hypothetical protein HU200_058914 [Digitaria exilis]|uniref:ABC transporter domain-containing protein n=1 Tax=Digitaria exilis TaxID=1010633 RepID=A0A835A8B4_9POAL|nr:hypothetical protein HU200_058914 [Digitaria exilis]